MTGAAEIIDTSIKSTIHAAWRNQFVITGAGQNVISALTAAGLVIRPVEPTEAMLDRGENEFKTAPREYDDDNRGLLGLVYKAMIGAGE